MKKTALISCILIIFWLGLTAQEEPSVFSFDKAQFSYHPGMIMPHVPSIDYMTNDHTAGWDLQLLHTTDGSRHWHQLYGQPLLGIGLYRGSLGNQKTFGRAHSLYGFFEAPVFRLRDKASLHYRMASGLSYINQTFDRNSNLYNIAIGSHINLHFNLSLLATLILWQDSRLVAGVGLTHFSNGKIRSPNKGLNVINGFLGIRHAFKEPARAEQPADAPPMPDPGSLSVIWSHGLKDHSRFKPAVYYVSSLNINYERRYARVAKYGIGLDAFYNPSLKNHQRNSPANDLANPALYRLGMHLSHDLVVGDFSLTLQLGHYLYNKIFYITDLYNRIGLKYYSSNNMILNLSLKSHNANAEFIEFGVGYQWN